MTGETHTSRVVETETMIMLSDDDDINHLHSSDDDDDADCIPTQVELKPVIAPSGVVVKVEKDRWKKDQGEEESQVEGTGGKG